ncbi:hypothetical protein BJ508DRAFT_366573 [Ascobolus immersus RN42]|uniref:Uncharacterized protein n=1 Tax=Ascobolus immersus RN42 TaxID=1160509 RepID=A0A3N4HPS2_ASCIM|nr:hypothetical protein BJ508DRAFT_366573 [Ascobolus immersus RN42]
MAETLPSMYNFDDETLASIYHVGDTRHPELPLPLPLWPLNIEDDKSDIEHFESILDSLRAFRTAPGRSEFLRGSTLLRYAEDEIRNHAKPTLIFLAVPGKIRDFTEDELRELQAITWLPHQIYESETQLETGPRPKLQIVDRGISTPLAGNSRGTLAGFVRDKKTGKLFGLTNHHVVSDDSKAIAFDEARQPPIPVLSPPSKLVLSTIERLETSIPEFRRLLYLERGAARTEEDFRSVALMEATVSASQLEYEELVKDRDQEDRRTFGNVVVSSGLDVTTYTKPDGKTYNRTKDWALISINVTESMRDRYDPETEKGNVWHRASTTCCFPVNWSLRPKPLSAASVDLKGMMVVKRGQGSGYTNGTVHGTYVDVTMDGNSCPTTEEAILPEGYSRPMMFEDTLNGERRNVRGFSVAGDSGSFIVTWSRRVIGILLGAEILTSGVRHYRMTYYTPIQDVFDDVRRCTGYDLEIVGN